MRRVAAILIAILMVLGQTMASGTLCACGNPAEQLSSKCPMTGMSGCTCCEKDANTSCEIKAGHEHPDAAIAATVLVDTAAVTPSPQEFTTATQAVQTPVLAVRERPRIRTPDLDAHHLRAPPLSSLS